MAVGKKRNGVGAICSVANKYLHPAKTVKDKYPNTTAHSRVTNLLVIRREVKKVRRKDQLCIVFRHPDFDNNIELHTVERWCKVETEGAVEHFFEPVQEVVQTTAPIANRFADEPFPTQEIQLNTVRSGLYSGDAIHEVRGQGLMVDDDNEPAQENIPDPAGIRTRDENNQTWGWDGVCKRISSGAVNNRPRLLHLSGDALSNASYVQMFLQLFPQKYLNDVLLQETNKILERQLTVGELLRYFGIWLVLVKSCPGRMSHSEYWSKEEVSRKRGAPYRFHDIMSGRRFNAITQALRYTSVQPPDFPDPFWEIRQLITAWNDNMDETFRSGWMTCLDESMSIWTQTYTCPGWIYCPRKPHPVGNEYHTICCGLSGILFAIEMVEGKHRPKELPSDDRTKKTEGLLMRLTKSLHGSGNVVVLDSGFCVLSAITALRKVGVFAGALIKKRRYWPKYVPGDEINERFKDKEVGSTDSLKGVLDGVHYDIMCMKEPDYVMKIMTTYGRLVAKSNQKESKRKWVDESSRQEHEKSFQYTEPFSNHFEYRHIVDDHNNLRHQVPAIEEIWATHRWATRVFQFILAITEVNCYLAFKYFVWKNSGTTMSYQDFRGELGWALIDNEFIEEQPSPEKERPTRRRIVIHDKKVAPPHAKKFIGGKWDTSAKAKYQQYVCRTPGCKAQIRTYCVCTPGMWLCDSCFIDHSRNSDF